MPFHKFIELCSRKGKLMGKSSKYPSYSTGTVSLNGQTKAKTYRRGNNVISDYNMSDAEKRAYDYAQNTFANSLKSLNTFDKQTQKDLNSQLNAYAEKGQKLISDMYTPIFNSLKNDIASRFGNFDNSVFMDNLNSIEANRAESMNSLAQDILSKRDELVNNELSRRYNYLNFLQDIQNQVHSNALSLLNTSQQNSASGNSYNAQAYAANRTSSGLGGYTNLASTALNALGGPYGTASGMAFQIASKYM